MQIQCEKLWLFETSVIDPFFLGTKDGVTPTMADDNPRMIEFINIETVYFFVDVIAKSGITFGVKYGGEDNEISTSYGKSHQDFALELNVPTKRQRILEELVGKQFSLLAMRRDLSHFIIFAQLEVSELPVDNEVQQRAQLKSGNSNARIFDVDSFNIENIIETITEDELNLGGFDYALDFQLD